METVNFRKKLIEIAQEESEDSRIAKIIAQYYPSLDLRSKETLFESLFRVYQLSENQEFDFDSMLSELTDNENIIDTELYNNKDYRIKNIEISNLRGIPSKEDNDNIPFGINFEDSNGVLNNAIILANNGTGKSSVFAALEMIYDYEIGEKNLRTEHISELELKDYEKYLERFPYKDKPYCKIETYSESFSLEKKIFSKELTKIIRPKNCFITEFDIIENGRLDYTQNTNIDHSFHNIVAENIGLKEYLDFIKVAEQVPNYSRRVETSNRNTIQKSIYDNKNTIKNRIALIQSKKIELEELNKGKDINTSTQVSEKFQRLQNLKNKNFEVRFSIEEYREIKNDFINNLRDYLSTDKDKTGANIINFLSSGKELLKNSDNCPFCLSSTKSKEEINKDVEQRLANYKEFEAKERIIRNSYRKFTNIIWSYILDLQKIYEIITQEREELQKFPRFDNVVKKELELFITLPPQINDEDFNDLLQKHYQTQFPQEKDY